MWPLVGLRSPSPWRGEVDFAVAEDHHVTVSVNGVTAGEVRFGGITEKVLTGTVPGGVLVDAANIVTVTVTAAVGAPYGLVNLDRITVTYPRRIVAVDGTAEFTASSLRAGVRGRVHQPPGRSAAIPGRRYRSRGTEAGSPAIRRHLHDLVRRERNGCRYAVTRSAASTDPRSRPAARPLDC